MTRYLRHPAPVARQRSLYPTMDSRPEIREPRRVAPAVQNNPHQEDLRRTASEWIRSHPELYVLLVDTARAQASAGATRLSINAIFEKIRADHPHHAGADGYGLNNNLRPYIARRIVTDIPQLEDLFNFRSTRW